jgi:hypothetical protein
MDFGLLSTCVFCTASLFGADLAPLPGFSAEMAFSYATLQRRLAERPTVDQSDITMKAFSGGFRWVRPGGGEWGAGTPATEIHLFSVFPNAHTESTEDDAFPDRIVATGEGRFENYGLLVRWALSDRLSAEGGYQQRRFKTTDLVNEGLSYYQLTEQRQLTSENVEWGLGLRFRARSFELAARWQHLGLVGKFNTANVNMLAEGPANGVGADLRWTSGPLTLGLLGQSAARTISRDAQFAPGFETVSSPGRASVRGIRFHASYAFSRVDVLLALSYNRSRMPFVTGAPLGAETRAFDGGFFVDSESKDLTGEFAIRYAVLSGLRVRLFLRHNKGSETVALTDATNGRPAEELKVDHFRYFPFLFGISAEFSVGGR